MKKTTTLPYPIMLSLIMVGLILFSCAAQYQKATVRSTPPLDYPLEAQMQEREGIVGLAVYVSGDSTVKTVELDQSSGHSDLDSAAVQFARQVSFNPARKGNTPVPSWTRLNVNFRLDRTVVEKEKRLEKFKAYHKQIASFENEEKRNTALEALYKLSTNYLGTVSLDADVKINQELKKVVSSDVSEYWQSLETVIPLPFLVLDDYIHRYPQSPRTPDARNRMVEYLDMVKDRYQNITLGDTENSAVVTLINKRISDLKNPPVSSIL